MRVKNVRRKARNKDLEAAGEALTYYRAHAGFTLQEAAKAIGTSASYLSEIENGIKKPRDEMLEKIAKLYGVPTEVLFEKFNRTPALIEELEKNDALKELLTQIRYSTILEEDEKKEVAEKVLDYFKELVEEVKERKKNN